MQTAVGCAAGAFNFSAAQQHPAPPAIAGPRSGGKANAPITGARFNSIVSIVRYDPQPDEAAPPQITRRQGIATGQRRAAQAAIGSGPVKNRTGTSHGGTSQSGTRHGGNIRTGKNDADTCASGHITGGQFVSGQIAGDQIADVKIAGGARSRHKAARPRHVVHRRGR